MALFSKKERARESGAIEFDREEAASSARGLSVVDPILGGVNAIEFKYVLSNDGVPGLEVGRGETAKGRLTDLRMALAGV